MAGKQLISADDLRKVLLYEPETGVFTWKVDRMCGRYSKQFAARAGQRAGSLTSNGRVQLRVLGKNYKAHVLAWVYHYGSAPASEIDHINGIASDNRILNLRLATRRVNNQNHRKANKNNALGVQGVKRNRNRFIAQLTVDGKTKHLGSFDSPEEAHAAYLEAKRKHHEGCTL